MKRAWVSGVLTPRPSTFDWTRKGLENKEKVLSLIPISISLAQCMIICGVTPGLASHETMTLRDQSQKKNSAWSINKGLLSLIRKKLGAAFRSEAQVSSYIWKRWHCISPPRQNCTRYCAYGGVANIKYRKKLWAPWRRNLIPHNSA